jgi:3-(3-hydroxy-phenyl)propionate hydroxylase
LLPQPWVEQPDHSRVRLDDVLGSGFALLRWADAPPLARLAGVAVKQVRLLRQSEDFLPTLTSDAVTPVIRDGDGVLGPLLDSAGADGVLLRPDRYVLAYLPRGLSREALAARLGSVLELIESS